MRIRGFFVAAVGIAGLLTALPAQAATDPTGFVNPFIGTTNAGNVYPGAVTPFGMLSWSPTTTRGDQTSAGAAGGYQYTVTRIRGFGLTHLNGTGCTPGASGDIPIMPFSGDVTSSPSADSKDAIYASNFSHTNEIAQPGYYKVSLDSGVTAELTATPRTGLGHFTFPAGKAANLLFRTSNSLPGSGNASVQIDAANRRVTGSVDGGGFCGLTSGGQANQRVYYRLFFTAQFDQPITGFGTWHNGTLTPNSTSATGGEGFVNRAGKGSGGYVSFAPGDVTAKVGISYVSLANAQANLNAENPAAATISSVRAEARQAWAQELGRVEVSGGMTDQLAVFYTALYHALLQPSLFSDVNGQYLGADMRTHQVSSGQSAQYGTFSGWDVYRAQVQLLALLDPAIAGDYAQSLVNFADQRGGEFDRWLHNNGKTSVMSGDPAAPAIAGMLAFGATNFDVQHAYSSLLRAATVPTADDLSDSGCPIQCTGERPSLDRYMRIHYVPSDNCHCWGAAAETLEDATADYAIVQLAKRMGDTATATTFGARAAYWKKVFDPSVRYARARASNGTWQPNFTPSTEDGFVEGTSARYTWMVYHDVVGLAAAMGGTATAVTRLDSFFHDRNGNFDLTATDPTRYDPGNEPDIQTPWLYDYLGRPYKTQETTQQILTSLWTNTTGGIPGNDDLGTMSSWYVFTAMGLYPQIPSRAELVLTAPLFPQVTIHRGNGKNIVIQAVNASAANKYVQALTLNGQASNRAWVPDSVVLNGGTLAFTLGGTPNLTWGATDLPPQG